MAKNALNVHKIISSIKKSCFAKDALRIGSMIKLKDSACAHHKVNFGPERNVFLAISQNISIVKRWTAYFVQIDKYTM